MIQSLAPPNPQKNQRERFRRPQFNSKLSSRFTGDSFASIVEEYRKECFHCFAHPTHSTDSQHPRSLNPPSSERHCTIKLHPPGTNQIDFIRYDKEQSSDEAGLIWINQTQYVMGIPPAIWNLKLGGKLLCQNWLSDRQGCILGTHSIEQYQSLINLLAEVVDLINDLDRSLQHHAQHRDLLTTMH